MLPFLKEVVFYLEKLTHLKLLQGSDKLPTFWNEYL